MASERALKLLERLTLQFITWLVGAAFVIGGALVLVAGRAISKTIKENSKKSKPKKRDCYLATCKGNMIFISAKGLTKIKDVTRGKKGCRWRYHPNNRNTSVHLFYGIST
ncbi:hypothetical protein [Glutamicibacter arilaitensis]|uniref:hypothetical protein n=1 Tax=Glutamicibacter arilaitensis TaxID=256701 RepID=UPI003A953C3F